MRKVVSGLFISLDGVAESPEKWQFDHFDAEIMQGLMATIADQDTVLLGRVTYQDWVAYWPNATTEPYASYINHVPKYVVSSSLEQVDWHNASLLRGPLAQEIARLKQLPGKNIGVAGSLTLVRELLMAGLLDELTLMVIPVIVGQGRRLFDQVSELKRLNLASARATSSGVAVLVYHPRDETAGPVVAEPAGDAAALV